jgi:hypothetical protein
VGGCGRRVEDGRRRQGVETSERVAAGEDRRLTFIRVDIFNPRAAPRRSSVHINTFPELVTHIRMK